jgi:hypothetical protein
MGYAGQHSPLLVIKWSMLPAVIGDSWLYLLKICDIFSFGTLFFYFCRIKDIQSQLLYCYENKIDDIRAAFGLFAV